MAAAAGNKLMQKFQALGSEGGTEELTPVMFPPGRLKLATMPALTGSPPNKKTIGIVVVAALAATRRGSAAGGDDDGDAPGDEVGRQRRQPIILTLGPAEGDVHVLAFDIAELLQAPAERQFGGRGAAR